MQRKWSCYWSQNSGTDNHKYFRFTISGAIKLKATNEQTRQTNKHSETDNRRLVTRRKGGGEEGSEG